MARLVTGTAAAAAGPHRGAHPWARVLGGLLLIAAATGCDATRRTARGVEQGLNPFASSEVSILRLDRHGPYLFVEFRSGRSLITILAPAADEACARMLRPEATLVYRRSGNFGRFERDGEACDPVGVGSLAAWRDRQPRGASGGSPIPRRTARFREIARDDAVVLVRGRFPLAGRVGVPNGQDVVAALPNEAVCARAIEVGTASLEFVPTGRQALRLVGERAPCPVLALAIPLDSAPSPD